METEELTIRFAQRKQPWTVPSYSDGANEAVAGPVPHALARHAVLHAAKAVGKLAAVFEKLDHTGGDVSPEQLDTLVAMSADLVTVGLRLANLHGFDLATALVARVLEKNGVNLLALTPQE